MKSLKGCCSWILLLVFLLLMACVACAWLLTARAAHAQETTPICSRSVQSTTEQAIQITGGITPPSPADYARGDFFENTLIVTLRGGECIVIASTADGHGMIWVDDAGQIFVTHSDGSTSPWIFSFQSDDHARIIPTLPKDISSLFHPGVNQVHIILKDLKPPACGASALWFVVFPALPNPTVAPSATSAAIMASPTSVVPLPTTTLQPNPTPTDTLIAALPVAATGQASDSNQNGPIPSLLLVGSVSLLVLAFVTVGLRMTQSKTIPAPLFEGTLNLLDEKTQESLIIELADFPKGFAILTDPLQVEALDGKSHDGFRAIPEVDHLRIEIDSEQSQEPVSLKHGDTVKIANMRFALDELIDTTRGDEK